jgi:hypothetical protein
VVIDESKDYFNMPLGLHESPHYAKAREKGSILARRHRRDDGVIGTFIGSNHIGMFWIEAEIVPTIL